MHFNDYVISERGICTERKLPSFYVKASEQRPRNVYRDVLIFHQTWHWNWWM